jgi:transcriptional regulator with XRE-family HTH domain
MRLAEKYGNPEFGLAISRISDIETKGIIPSIYKLYSLAAIYRQDIRSLLKLYDVNLGNLPADHDVVRPPVSHKVEGLDFLDSVVMPTRMDPGFDPRSTSLLGRMVMTWGPVPMSYLQQFSSRQYSYAYVGSEDWTMNPLIKPGTLLQLDETETTVAAGPFASEYERPVYFVELRDGFRCCWCEVAGSDLVMLGHSLSRQATRVAKYGTEAEIVGRVVGFAMRLDFERKP